MNRWRRRAVTAIALPLCVVSMVLALLLIMPSALTQESEHGCGMRAHVHTADCYAHQLVCEIPEEESAEHRHTDACYITEHILSCKSEEEGHVHDDVLCYADVPHIVCGMEESVPTHVHNAACYDDALVCGTPAHTHTEACEAPAASNGSHELEQFLTELTVTDNEGTVLYSYVSNVTSDRPDAPPTIGGSGEFVCG